MADNLIFPIGFDLEEAVKKAGQEWNSTYADKLEKLLAKRAITVNLGFSTKNLNNLDDVKRRLAELKIEPLTPENKTAIRELVRELKELARIMEKIQKFKGIELPELQMAKAAKLRKDVAQADEKLRLSQERVRQSEERLILSQQRAAQQADRTSKAYGTQSGYLERLIKRMAIYASFSYAVTSLTSVREVTAQFELQRVSLGAILQDANKGAQIFSQIKQFALKSPISILDLTKYTKQLAAYKIGYDELFDTTKRLADVSVGLGVDFQRIVLLYGQVRATGYLRASEVRQATEAGIPLVEELAAKLTKANGELVTAADVMDMISKRAISFDMVKDVFTDMTSAGGTFYNMQEKQGNTLYGLWAKLGDAASVMYEQIGNTGVVNEGMKEAIQMLTELMRNWKAVGLTAATSILPAVAAMAAWKMATKALAKSVATATAERIAAEAKLATAMKGTDIAAQNAARSSLAKAKADEAAAIAAQKNATAQSRLKMGFVSLGKTIASGLGIGIAVMLVTNLIYKFYEALTNFRKLKRELGSIYTETATLQDQSVRNFEFLADKAVKAANGSKEQTDALQELNRTYRDILPQEALTIENLTKMKGKYDALTQSIREYVAEQQRQKAESAIMEYYGTRIRDAQNDVRERLYDQDLSATEVGRFFAEFEKVAPKYGADTWGAFREAMLSAGVKDKKLIAKIWKEEFEFTQRDIVSSDTGNANIRALSQAYADQANELKGMNERYRESIGNLGDFEKMQKRVSDAVANATYKTSGGKPIDTDTQGDLLDAMKLNLLVKQTAAEIQNNEDIKKAFAYMGEGIKSEWFSIINAINSNDLGKVSQINFDAIIASVDSMIAKLGNKNPEILAILNTFRNYLVAQKKQYENMAPSETVVVRWQSRWRAIVKELQISGQNMNRFLMQSGEDFEAYRKRIKEEVVAVINTINVLNEAIKARIGARAAGDDKYTKEQEAADKKKLKQAQERKVALEKLLADLNKIEIETGKKKKGSKGSKSDTRLQVLQEVAQTLATINKEYDDLAKKEGASKALADIKERFKDVLSYANKLGGKFGLNFVFPTEFKTLQEYRNAILKVMQSLKGLPKGSEKTILDFKTMIGKADSDYLQKQIESELKRLADRISRTKTAKEFYEKILEQTGNIDIATRVSMSIYGSTGEELFKDTVKQIREAFKTGSEEHPIDLDISAAIDLENQRIDYKKLADIYEKYQNEIIEKRRDTAKKIAQEGQKEVATDILNWRKSLAKAKSYEQKRTDIINTATAERAKIIRETTDPKERGELLGLSYSKQAQELAKLAVDEFKSSDDYIKVFQDLDRVSTQTLDRMKKRLEEMIATVKDTENVEGLKTLVEQLDKIKEERETRNPIEGIIDSFKEYAKARKDYRTAEAEEAAAKAEFAQQEVGLNQAIRTAKAEQAIAQQRVNDLKAQGKENTSEGVAAELVLNEATKRVTQATENRNKAVKKVNNAEQKTTGALDAQKAALAKLQKNVNAMANAFSSAASSIKTIADMMGIAEDSELGDIVNGLVDGLNNAATIMTTILAIAIAIEAACWWMLAIGAAVAAFSAIGSWLTGSKVRKANKEIERQQELLDQLEYTYGRLEKAADKLFGRDYVDNYNQQLKNLQAQQQAYLKQAEAERSKGKKEDKEKTKEYEEQARETANKIKELQDDLVAHFTGSTKTDVARQMAKSWIDARASMSDTFAAIKGDYQDLIKNMIVEGAAARVIENALTPVWDSMQKMLDKNDVQGAIDSLVNGMDSALSQANNGMEVLWKALEARGYDMKSLISDTDSEYSGIAKSVAGATSEEINNVAAIGNTLMYYVSPIPRIDENLARVVALMEGRTAALPTASGVTSRAVDYTDLFNTANQHLSSLPRMEQHLAEIHTMLGRALRTKGSTTGFNTFLNS